MKYLISSILILLLINTALAQTGTIRGRVIDNETGEAMIGVNVYLDSTTLGGSTDLNGNYTIKNIPPGTYTLVGSFITYATKRIEGVEVKGGDVKVIDFGMGESQTELKEVIVKAKAIKNSENALLAMQKKSLAVQDGLSSQEMGKTGASSAAESAKQITGTSVIDGKYVYVRGLGDRYSTAQLNGASLVSTDPYINSVPLDLIPSNLLDNMITVKTATPDQPGNFSGGIVNLNTKDFPEKMTFNLSNSLSYNPQSSFNSDFLTHQGGKHDWLGYDDGTRQLPLILQDEENMALLSSPVFYIQARRDEEKAQLLDEASKSLNPQMEATTKRSFTNYSSSFSFGNQYSVLKNPLGVIFGLTHSKNYASYNDGKNQAWDITGSDAEELFTYYDLVDHKSVENPIVSSMAGLSYRIGQNNEIGILNIYNHDTEKLSRYQTGKIPGIVSGGDNIFETRTLQFRERGLNTTQVKGKHLFQALNNTEISWIGSYTRSFQHEPDLRFFANETIGDSLFYISVSEYDLPYHYYRYLNDTALELRADVTIPLSKASGNINKIKVGISSQTKTRDFREYRYYYKSKDGETYQGDQEAFFGPENTGVIGYDSLYNRWMIGNYLVDNTKISNNYSGREHVSAVYAMAVLKITKDLKFIGGSRLEKTVMHVESADSAPEAGDIDQFNFFPSVNLIYSLSDKTNIRGSFSQTIARPTMRELAPFVTFDFIGGFLYLGNPALQTTLIRNFDLRWEHFIKSGEVIALSGYYKHFVNPIVKAYNTEAINPEILFQNTNDAQVYGFEVDFRKNLSFINPRLENFKLNTNFSYILSRVALDTTEYRILAGINPDLDPYRPFQGQSPFLFNVMLSYFSPKAKFGADLGYNVFGKRLSAIGLNGLPDVYDQPRGLLNLGIHQALGKYLQLKFRVNNILNAEYLTLQTFKDNAYLNESYKLGTSFSFGISYNIQ